MIYDMQCNRCGAILEVVCPLSEHELNVKSGRPCPCGGWVTQIITVPKIVFGREGFPKGDPRWEHVTDEPVEIKDKYHLKDLCEQNGSVSRYLEDAV